MTDEMTPWQRHHENSDALCAYMRERMNGETLLAFSAGKDAVCAWLQLRKAGFTRIVPYYQWTVPDLEFVEQGLRYYEDFFETKILRVPHPSVFRQQNALIFQPPERAAIIEELDIPNVSTRDVNSHVRRVSGVADDTFVAFGTRAADSPVRYLAIKKHGAVNPKEKTYQPIFDWKMAEVRQSILESGVKLTIDYRLFGRSFDGIDYRFLAPIKEHFPDDYQRILEWYPLAELELLRRNLKPENRP